MTESRDIAIVGISCSFPGSSSVGTYWNSIQDGRTHFRSVPADRWDHTDFYSPDPRDTDTTYASRIACLDDIRSFAPERFKMPPRRVRAMDPQQRLMLDHVRLAVDDAGYGGRPLPRSTGVYVGASVAEYKDLVVSRLRARQIMGGTWGILPALPDGATESAVSDVADFHQYSMLGVLLNMIACNVSEAFDLRGPALVTDSACSSALVALHEAVLHLRAGVCDAAIVGGVYTICTPDLLVGFSRIGALSRTDVCRPFDAGADGFVLGEGVGAVILKRFDDSVRDGDRVWAVIKGVGLNNDGRGDGPMTPRLSGQIDALARAYKDARVSPHTVRYVEAHGTATPVGDLTEIAALKENARRSGTSALHCAVTSVKGNIGHTLAASGIAGLIKAVLVLDRGVIPPQAGWQGRRDALGLDGSGFYVPTGVQPFVRNGAPRRAGVNAFGFGGTNVHVVLEERPVVERRMAAGIPEAPDPQLFAISADTPAALGEYLQTLIESTRGMTAPLRDVAFTLTVARRRERARVAFVAGTHKELAAKLLDAVRAVRGESLDGISYASAPRPHAHRKVAFLFPGHVARRSELCTRAYRRFPALRKRLEAVAESLVERVQRPLSSFFDGQDTANALTGPMLAAMQLALVDFLQGLGVRPDAVMGDGTGSLIAAATGGMLQRDTALRFVADGRSSMAGLQTTTASIPVISSFDLDATGMNVFVQIGGSASHRSVLDLVDDHFLDTVASLAVLGTPLELNELFDDAQPVTLPSPPLAARSFWITGNRAQVRSKSGATSTRQSIVPSLEQTAAQPIAAPAGDVRKRLFELIAKVSSFPLDMLNPELTLGDHLGFDSLMMVEMYAGLTESFPEAKHLSQSLLRNQTTVEDIVRAVTTAIAARTVGHSASGDEIQRYVVKASHRPLRREPARAELPFDGPIVLIEDSSGVAVHLRALLERAGRRITASGAGDCAWIDLTGLDPVPDSMGAAELRAPVMNILCRAAGVVTPTAFVTVHRGFANVGVTGAMKAIAREWPDTFVKSIELAAGASAESSAETIFHELITTDPTVEISYATGRREVLSLERAAIARNALPESVVVAISGGGRGLGAKLAVELAKRHHARLLLLGRSPDANAAIHSIRDAGGDALYVRCDVCDAAQVQSAFAQCRRTFGPVSHIVHAAGILADEPLSSKDLDRAAAVFDTKVAGCLALWDAARPDPPVSLLIYGSWAGRFGHARQSDYSAANHVLGRLASVLGGQSDVRVVTIDLPPWEGSGMVDSLPEGARRALRSRVRFLTDEAGLECVIAEMAAAGNSEEVIVGANLGDEPSTDRAVIRPSASKDAWLEDHVIGGRMILPFAYLIDEVACAAQRLGLGAPLSISSAEITELLDTTPFTVSASVSNGMADVNFESAGRRQASLRCRASTAAGALPMLAVPPGGSRPALSVSDFYRRHTFHGPRLQALTRLLEVGPSHAVGVLRTTDEQEPGGAAVDILTFDGLLQLCAYWASVHIGRIGFPIGADEIRVLARPQPGTELRAVGILRDVSGEILDSDLDLLDPDGRPVAQIRRLRCKLADGATTQRASVGASNSRIEDFPEVQALHQRMEMARIAGMRNPYFSVHERVTNDTTVIGGREYVNFASYNYLGLSGDPDVTRAAIDALHRYGTSVSASRLASGEKPLHRELEQEIAGFLGCEDAVVMVGGHATNVSVIGHLFGPQDLVLHDSLAHDSILAGIRLAGARRRPFPHNDYAALDHLVHQLRGSARRLLIAVEGVYSMDGDIAPLDRVVEIKRRHNALLFVDEAHSLGVLGDTGRGIGEHCGVARTDVELWMGTISKSLASCGGYIAGSAQLVRYLKYSNPGFVYSVGVSPANAAAALAALRKLDATPEIVARLQDRSRMFLDLCRQRGINTGFSAGTAVVPCVVGNSPDCLRLSETLARRFINVQPILYPAVEEHQARLRFFLTALHTDAQLRMTADALAEELAALDARYLNAEARVRNPQGERNP